MTDRQSILITLCVRLLHMPPEAATVRTQTNH